MRGAVSPHPHGRGSVRSAFTLIEMMVVVAIIALLIAVLLPTFAGARTSAQKAQCASQFQALSTGLETFRQEQALGGTYPPSASDKAGTAADFQIIANPKKSKPAPANNGGQPEVRIAGAHLLYHALLGADGLGTPGFRDLSKDALWWNDTHDDATPGKEGAYAIAAATGKEVVTRYGGGGYVDDKMKQRAGSLAQLVEKGVIVNTTEVDNNNIAKNESLFLDPWDHPILYYRANSYNIRMTTSKAAEKGPGIYRQEDNGIITGTDGDGIKELPGFDFGQGSEGSPPLYHYLAKAKSPDPADAAATVDKILSEPGWDKTFAKFIIDGNSKVRPTPVRKDSFLFISAGPDGRYGTSDDVTNWPREQK